MICKNCGCYISFLLDECPGCGEPKYMSETPKQSNGNAYGAASATYTTGGTAASVSRMNSATAGNSAAAATHDRVRISSSLRDLLESENISTGTVAYVVDEQRLYSKMNNGYILIQ